MASLNQLVSEIVNSLGQPNNHGLRQNVKNLIIHTRNELIRRSFEKHGYVDKIFSQRYKVSLIDVGDGDINLTQFDNVQIDKIKRTLDKVKRPVRLTNNLPFNRVSTAGYKSNIEIPFIKETNARFTNNVPGLCGLPRYDYINEYIYIFPSGNNNIDTLGTIIIEAAFENPTIVSKLNEQSKDFSFDEDDDEWFLPEDMIGTIKDIIYKRDLLDNIKETNETPKENII